MPNSKVFATTTHGFGERLAYLRKKMGYSMRSLAAEIGISHRVIAYYENETKYPPTHLLPLLAKALGTTADELLGLKSLKEKTKVPDSRLWRRFKQVEKLPPVEKKQIVQYLDTFLDRQRLRQEAA